MPNLAERILTAISVIRMPPMPEEYRIHEEIASALQSSGIDYIHEAKLGPGCRVDFLCGSIAIEVKKGRPQAAPLKKQLYRYLQFDNVSSIILVLQKPCALPEAINGKNVHIIALNRLWGVALP